MRYVAFLRAINVGGRVVRMDDLRRLFSSLGFSGVQTFIASGNVIFESTARNIARLESSIEKALEQSLGYPVATFVRSQPELTEIAAHPLVSGEKVPSGATSYVMFLRALPEKGLARRLASYNTDVDRFELADRHVLWMIKGTLLDSAVSSARFEKTLTGPVTVRNATTVRKLAAKLASPR